MNIFDSKFKDKIFPSYKSLLASVESKKSEVRWGFGILPPFSLEPYRMELNGMKRGKWLKNISKPGKHKHEYHIDDVGNIIREISYGEKINNTENEWMHSDDFYEFDDDGAWIFVFGQCGGKSTPVLFRVVRIFIKEKIVQYSYSLELSGGVSHFIYYINDENGNVVKITIEWDNNYYPKRVFDLFYKKMI